LRQTLHGEPYMAADLYLFDGNMNQVVYVIPSQDLVILRTGGAPPRGDGSEWDNAYLPNTILRGIVRDKRTSVPQPVPPGASAGTGAPQGVRLTPVRRTTIATADPEASLHFYRDLLGFVVEYDRAEATGGRLAGFDPGATRGRLIALRQGPRLGGSIGLFHAPGIRPAGDCAAPSRVPAMAGEVGVLLLTDDLPTLQRRLAAAGVAFADQPYRYEVNRGPTDTFTVFDPNCVRVSIAQIQQETLEQSLRR
jgi:catechol 2,3-dioxygenase-like lactoylglutathione lyase family enzyme